MYLLNLTRIRAYSIVRHIGRASGRVYSTPVSAYPYRDGFVIPILYGTDSQWVRNVLATGRFALLTNGIEHDLERPAIIRPAEAMAVFPALLQRVYRMQNINDFVWAHAVTPESADPRGAKDLLGEDDD